MEKKNQGFTLVELLIVIGIISILASAVVIAMNPAQHFVRARNAARWSHMNSIANSIYSYAIDNDGVLPDCNDSTGEPLSDGATDDFDNARDISECYSELVSGDPSYMSSLPQDPAVGDFVPDSDDPGATGYQISSSTEGNRIRIESTSPEASEIVLTQ